MRSTTLKKNNLSWEISYFVDKELIDSHVVRDSLIAHEHSEAFLRGDYWSSVDGSGVYFDPLQVIRNHGDPGIYMGDTKELI